LLGKANEYKFHILNSTIQECQERPNAPKICCR